MSDTGLREALAAEIAHLPKNDGREMDDETHGYVEAWAQVARLMNAIPPEPDDLGERVRAVAYRRTTEWWEVRLVYEDGRSAVVVPSTKGDDARRIADDLNAQFDPLEADDAT